MVIWARVITQFEAFHCWPEAPRTVDFLRHPHRHIFHVTVWVEQTHMERDVEYVLFKRHLQNAISAMRETKAVSTWSCETWAKGIGEVAQLAVPPGRRVKVEVLEDGENGALVEM